MAKRAYLFPGQGSQSVGMGADLYEHVPAARKVMDEANTILGFSITDIMFGIESGGDGAGGAGGAETDAAAVLTQTQNTQPALFVHSMAMFSAMKDRFAQPDMVAGHSLGEYSALCAAGALSFEDALRTVRLRGELMATAGKVRPGAMAAILNMEDADVEALCAEVSRGLGTLSSAPCEDGADIGIVQAANYNSPGQIVISGDVKAVARAVELAPERGARRAILLPVSGAFHSPLMDFATEGLGKALAALSINKPTCPVFLNVTAEASLDPDVIRQKLVEQLTAPVRWAQTLLAMQAAGATQYVEVGAGKVLSGLVKRTLDRTTETSAFGTAADLDT